MKTYAGWTITHDPKPIPDRRFDYDFVHDNYDGTDYSSHLCGNASSLEECLELIEEVENNV